MEMLVECEIEMKNCNVAWSAVKTYRTSIVNQLWLNDTLLWVSSVSFELLLPEMEQLRNIVVSCGNGSPFYGDRRCIELLGKVKGSQ